jgi:DNA-binding NarL/FixJ family response regulator
MFKMADQNVLIVEDDPTWQNLFIEIIADAGFSATVVASVSEAEKALDAADFALAVVDISLSLPDHADRGGVRVLRYIAAGPKPVPTIVVTGYATVELAVETLADLDARYLFRKEEFNRRRFIQLVQKTVLMTDPLADLSEREQEVLELISQGLTNKMIADELVISVNTVKKHVQSIFTKLNVDSRAAAVARALSRGQ